MGGGGVKPKKPSAGAMDIFWNHTLSTDTSKLSQIAMLFVTYVSSNHHSTDVQSTMYFTYTNSHLGIIADL